MKKKIEQDKLTYLKVVVPWGIIVPRKTMKDKKYAINLNTYRNLNFRVNNLLKKLFKALMEEQLSGKVLKTPVKVKMQPYKPTKRIVDKGNLYGMASKYLYDAMTEYGCWEDDNDEYIGEELLFPAIHDKNNGRIEFEFFTVDEKEGK